MTIPYNHTGPIPWNVSAGIGVRAAIWMTIIVLLAGSVPTIITPAQGADGDEWGYHTSFQIAEIISDLARSNPDRATATTAQALLGLDPIEGDRTIPILFIGDPSENDNPNVLFLGAHHGNEPDSAEGVVGFASYILGKDTDINTQVMDHVNIIIVPVVNPYGLDKGIRVDENGEDPNRDYPFSPSPPSSDSDGIPLTTRGARTVHELANRYPISVALSIHTGSWGIFTTWGAQGLGNITPDHRSLMDLAKGLSKASAQNMLYGPANDFKGISYLNGAYDDHLYGSSVLPEKEYSPNMVLPYSTAAFTIELGTQLGKDPTGLGSPADMDSSKPSARSVPTAIRICLAACLMASPSVSARLSGAEAEFTIYGADSAGGMVLDEVSSEGMEPLQIAIEIDPIYPIVTLGASPGSGAASIYLHGPIHPAWMDVHPNAYPPLAPRSLLAQSSLREVGKVLPVGSISHTQPVMIDDISLGVKAGSTFNISVVIDTDERITDLTMTVRSGGMNGSNVYRGSVLVKGKNMLRLKAPTTEGYAVATATLRTSGGDFSDALLFEVRPDLIWTVRLEGTDLRVYTEPVGLTSVRPVIVRVHPVGTGSAIAIDPFSFYIGQGKNENTIDLSRIWGEYSVSVFFPPDDLGRKEIIEIPPTIAVSRVPIHIEGGKLTLGPVTAYLGGIPLQWIGPFGNNTVTVMLTSGSETSPIVLDYVPLGSLTDAERSIAYDQATIAGSDPSQLDGAFIRTLDLPEPGDYSVVGYIVNDRGEFRAPEGNATERIYYDSFSVTDGKGNFPLLLVLLFMALIGVMVVVSYLRFPAKMESLAKREMEKKDMESRRHRR
jgi:hypothetical protein